MRGGGVWELVAEATSPLVGGGWGMAESLGDGIRYFGSWGVPRSQRYCVVVIQLSIQNIFLAPHLIANGEMRRISRIGLAGVHADEGRVERQGFLDDVVNERLRPGCGTVENAAGISTSEP